MTKLVGQQLEMQVLKSLDLENESPEIQQIFSPLKVYIENGVTQLKTSSNTAVEGLPTCSNENLIKVLHSLSTLGKKAEEDLQSIERYRQDVVRLESTEDRQENSFEEHKELGISGATLEKPQDSPRFVPDDLFGYRKEPLPEDNSLQNVYSLLKKCRNLLQNVNGQAQSRDNLMKLLKLEDELMVNLRKYKALQSVCLSLPIENEEQLNRDLHALFANTFKHISSSDSQLSAYMKGAWVWEVSPEPSVLPSTKIDGLKLR
ncbi:hypothetical protein PoB_004939700 [Plakobranchus ocellatus]|uniref:Uncharacterized protein n=1 Tax=Plakobranchus ocellatus TaxID=259542 RepID=A0AAV4BV40_9GAST|nr:hypothetical protein PoB_004939700 [Plakobranchus ocellatus]